MKKFFRNTFIIIISVFVIYVILSVVLFSGVDILDIPDRTYNGKYLCTKEQTGFDVNYLKESGAGDTVLYTINVNPKENCFFFDNVKVDFSVNIAGVTENVTVTLPASGNISYNFEMKRYGTPIENCDLPKIVNVSGTFIYDFGSSTEYLKHMNRSNSIVQIEDNGVLYDVIIDSFVDDLSTSEKTEYSCYVDLGRGAKWYYNFANGNIYLSDTINYRGYTFKFDGKNLSSPYDRYSFVTSIVFDGKLNLEYIKSLRSSFPSLNALYIKDVMIEPDKAQAFYDSFEVIPGMNLYLGKDVSPEIVQIFKDYYGNVCNINTDFDFDTLTEEQKTSGFSFLPIGG